MDKQKALDKIANFYHATLGGEYDDWTGQYMHEEEINLADIFPREFNALQELVDMHTQPLKLEEIKAGMWVWDNKKKTYMQVKRLYKNYLTPAVWNEDFDSEYDIYEQDILFEKGRFYRYQPVEV